MSAEGLVRLLSELVFLLCLFAAGCWLPISLAERRFDRSPRLGDSLPATLRRARRWRWLTAPAAVLLGLMFIGFAL